ncbi:hypothetical protein H0H93_013203 [Arthromyces matolae]|nr:hypothetical protein H0H93_013203 [Arthromyces matolae]
MSASSSQYIDQKTVNASYRPKAGAMSEGLKRARAPYRVRNAVTGLALGAFAVGVWAYSISAVKQDVFDDVDEEARAMAHSGTMAQVLKDVTPLQPIPNTTAASFPAAASSSATQRPRGILQHLDGRFPRLLDPENKTLVWGAPPVDNVGKLGKP